MVQATGPYSSRFPSGALVSASLKQDDEVRSPAPRLFRAISITSGGMTRMKEPRGALRVIAPRMDWRHPSSRAP